MKPTRSTVLAEMTAKRSERGYLHASADFVALLDEASGGRAYLATDGCPSDMYDLDTGARRRTTNEDLRKLMPDLGELSFERRQRRPRLCQLRLLCEDIGAGSAPDFKLALDEMEPFFLHFQDLLCRSYLFAK